MSAESAIEFIYDEEPTSPHLQLAPPLRPTRPPAGYAHGPMANWEVCTWSTQYEPVHTYTPENGVISYRESDGARGGVPVRFYGEAALQYLEK